MRIPRTSRQRGFVWCLALLSAAGMACGSSSGKTGGSGGTGGGGAAGGVTGLGGIAGSDGTTTPVAGSGGVASTGGATGTGGPAPTRGTGGQTGSGGAPGMGGATGTGGGSAPARGTGGQPPSGGAPGTGGVPAVGGQAGSTGGISSGGTGGSASKGGTTGNSGSGGSGGSGAAVPSSGCNTATTLPSGKATIDVSGTSREYILTLPASYDPGHPYRLIFAFHGRQYTDQNVVDGTGPAGIGPYYDIAAQANGNAIFVAPQATSASWSSSDVPYVTAMIARFEAQLCIDQSRIFATGFSMGAIMTITLGCTKADVFRAIAPMSGEISGTCSGTQPIAYWSSHGTSDPTINISNGQAARDAFVTRNHCTSQTTPGSPSGCVNYVGCDAGYPVIWCPFDGVHQPAPFGGTAIWAFFSQF